MCLPEEGQVSRVHQNQGQTDLEPVLWSTQHHGLAVSNWHGELHSRPSVALQGLSSMTKTLITVWWEDKRL